MNALICAIVVYNTKIEDSETIKIILQLKERYSLQLKVADNSTSPEIIAHNNQCAKSLGIYYYSMNGNKGLSQAYNIILNDIFKEAPDLDDILIWFDDDTMINENYFEVLQRELFKSEKKDIYVPIIVGQDGKVWSPNRAGFLKNKLVKNNFSCITNKNFNAINSCTAARLRVYDNYRYDERLFLDQVDHKFYFDERQANRNFGIIDVKIIQNFSQRTNKVNINDIYTRLRIRFKDIIIYGSIRGRSYKLLALVKCIGISIELGIRSKSVSLGMKGVKLAFNYYLTERA